MSRAKIDRLIFCMLLLVMGLPCVAATVFGGYLVLSEIFGNSASEWDRSRIGLGASFCIVFGCAAAGFLFWAYTEFTRDGDSPGSCRPWLEKQWRKGRIRCLGEQSMRSGIAVAVFWNVVSAPCYPMIYREVLIEGHHLALLALVFPIVGLALIYRAAYATVVHRNSGTSTLELTPRSGTVGGTLEGVITTSTKIDTGSRVRARLVCERWSAPGETSYRDVLWETEHDVDEDRGSNAAPVPLPVHFEIPDDCHPTDLAAGDDSVHWFLRVTARANEKRFRADFEVPVYRVATVEPSRGETPGPLRLDAKAASKVPDLPNIPNIS